ncbi:hypothetical protein STEG23_018024, partial [Scotinomys teguina]
MIPEVYVRVNEQALLPSSPPKSAVGPRAKSPDLFSVGAARSGNLTFMVGGVEEEFAAAQELLGCMGSNVVYCGAVGTGQSAKICNNMLLAINMIGTAEAMNLGIRSGLDPKLLAKILNMSSGRCWSSDTYNPVPGVMDGVPSSNNYQGGFGTTLMAKQSKSDQIRKSPGLMGKQPSPGTSSLVEHQGRLCVNKPLAFEPGDKWSGITWEHAGSESSVQPSPQMVPS